ncbi:arginine--tRNA ligase [Candidatus Peregrinibacteria bacterium]|nr:arginine--tRNA ligase [Candidatus Peregrinibacteria bacterium]
MIIPDMGWVYVNVYLFLFYVLCYLLQGSFTFFVMKFVVSEKISEKYPSLSFGVVVAKRIDNKRKTNALAQIYDGLQAQIQKEFNDVDPKKMPKVSNWRSIFETISAKTFETSMEQVLYKALKHKELPFPDNMSRIRDYCMLKWQMPIMCFSLDDIYGDIELVEENGAIFYKDQAGALTKKWNSKQFSRGSITRETEHVVCIIENLGIMEENELEEKMHEMALMIQRYCHGGEFEEDIIQAPRKEKDLGVVGLSEYKPNQYKDDVQKPSKTENSSEKNDRDDTKDDTKDNTNAEEKNHEKKEAVSSSQPTKAIEQPLDTNSLKARLTILLQEACQKAFPEADVSSLKIEYPRDPEHGDYACSIAMKLSKRLLKDPPTIAEKIVQHIEPVQFIGSVEVALPGFINIAIARPWLESKVKDIAEGGALYDTTLGGGKAVVFDYSSPNTAKPLGVHHLLSTVIGQALYNLYAHIGFTSIGINHLGDWGTQFGKLIYAYKTWGSKKTVEKNPVSELLKLYVKFHEEAEQDRSLEDKGREEFKKLEEGNKENHELWSWFNELSRKDLEATYEELGIHFDEYIGESYFNDKMKPIIDEGKEKGVFKEGEKGALIVEFEDGKTPPYMIQKSDGATLYSTRDLATLAYRLQRWEPSQLVYVVDSAQSLHFKQLFATARMLGYTSAKLKHVSFGRMHLPDRSMSTRKGNVVLLEEVLNEAQERARKIVEEKSGDLKKKEREQIAKQVAIGAIKYNILSQNRTTDITFDWDKMLSIEGNSAPYLQYTVARAHSIIRKYNELVREGKKPGKSSEKDKKQSQQQEENEQIDIFEALDRVEGYDDNFKPLEHPLEIALARMIVKCQEYMVAAVEEYKPHIVATYLYEVAQQFNSFYNTVSVLQADSKQVRLVRLNLTKSVIRIVTEGLTVLGIEVPERM